jgi:hypothetical protein
MFTREEIMSLTPEDLASLPPAFRIPLIDAQEEMRRQRRYTNIGIALILTAAAIGCTIIVMMVLGVKI